MAPSTIDDVWRRESDEQLEEAAGSLWQFTEDARQAIRAEVERRNLVNAEQALRAFEEISPHALGEDAGNVRLVDISPISSALSWIRFGSRLHFGLAIFFLIQALSFLAQAMSSNDDRFGISMALLPAAGFVASIIIRLGMRRYFFVAGIISAALLALPLIAFGVVVLNGSFAGRDFVLALGSILLGLLMLPPVVGLWRYRNQRRHLQSGQSQFQSFQNWSSLGAIAGYFGLAAVCLILMLAAFGSISQRLVQGMASLLVSIAGCAMMGGAIWSYLRARRHALLSALDLRKSHPGPPILFLRSFSDDQIEFRSLLRGAITLEEDITRSLSYHGPVVAIGRPGETLPPLGAARDYVRDDEWKNKVAEYMRSAAWVVMIIGKTAGLEWEVQHARAEGAVGKLILIIPPFEPDNLILRWKSFVSHCPQFAGVSIETIVQDALALRIKDDGEIIVITDRSGGESDYYEAMHAVIAA
jgi:hypothetical protein